MVQSNILLELTDEEFDLYLKIRNAEILEGINEKQNTMKNIMLFWLVLTVMPVAIAICFLCKNL